MFRFRDESGHVNNGEPLLTGLHHAELGTNVVNLLQGHALSVWTVR
jgi:hypothetical protein